MHDDTKYGAAPVKILLKTFPNEDAFVEASSVQEFHQITELHIFDSNKSGNSLIPLLGFAKPNLKFQAMFVAKQFRLLLLK